MLHGASNDHRSLRKVIVMMKGLTTRMVYSRDRFGKLFCHTFTLGRLIGRALLRKGDSIVSITRSPPARKMTHWKRSLTPCRFSPIAFDATSQINDRRCFKQRADRYVCGHGMPQPRKNPYGQQ